MKTYKCENCGAELRKNADDTYACSYCKRTYYDDSLEKAYDRVYQNLQSTVTGSVSDELVKRKLEQIANCRQALYKARTGQFIDSKEIEKWSEEILKLSPDDVQANFYALAAKKRWGELNKFMQKLNGREVGYLVEGFVDYLTSGQLAEKCILSLNDLIGRAFNADSKEFCACHKKINDAAANERSGIFDVELSRDVFVAYSSKDKEKAYELVEYLEENGLTCFIAMRNLAKGVDAELQYNERLKKAIDNCQVFVLVSSKNSRSRDCDAYNIELRYVKERDISRAEDFDYANAHYELYLESNRKKCKARVEYLIEEYGNGIYEQAVKKFFGGLTWCTDLEAVGKAVFDYVENKGVCGTSKPNEANERKERFSVSRALERGKSAVSHAIDFGKSALSSVLEEKERNRLEEEKERLRQEAEAARLEAEKERLRNEKERLRIEAEKERLQKEKEKIRLEKEKKEKSRFLREESDTSPLSEDESGRVVSKKYCNKWIALFLCLYLGWFGVHRFYEGDKKWGIIYLCSFGLCGIGWYFDVVRILFKKTKYPKLER